MINQTEKEEYILKFKKELNELGIAVGEIEYTENNYDNNGNLIDRKISTITTEHCEIGKYNNNCYFVFVIYAESFNKDFFEAIKSFNNIQIYDFIDFNKTLYPGKDFDYNNFEKNIKQKKCLQIQFDFDSMKVDEIIINYKKIIEIFLKYNINIVNQLEVDLQKEKSNKIYDNS